MEASDCSCSHRLTKRSRIGAWVPEWAGNGIFETILDSQLHVLQFTQQKKSRESSKGSVEGHFRKDKLLYLDVDIFWLRLSYKFYFYEYTEHLETIKRAVTERLRQKGLL